MKSKKLDITKKETNPAEAEEANSLCYFSLFRYASKWDLILIFFGVVATFLKSLAMPFMIITYGEFTTLLVDRTYGIGTSSPTLLLQLFGGGKILTNATAEENRNEIINDSISYGILLALATLLQFLTGIVGVDCFNHTALRQITKIRINFFDSMMKQEIGWYDVAGGNHNFAVRITEDVEKIRDGISEKVSHFLALIFSFVICVIMSFVYGWKLTLVIIAYVPIVIVTNTILGKLQASLSAKEIDAYAAAANVAEEVLSGVRTVFAFSGERIEIDRYNKRLVPAKKAGRRKGFLSGVGDGVMRFLFFASNAVAFWYGVQLVLDDRDKTEKQYTPAVLMITFFGLIVGAENIAKTAPFLESFAAACGSAATIFKVIDRPSKINSMSNEGKMINFGVKGNIEFKNISFNYPSRPDVPILRGLNVQIEAGKTVAFVGNSGNGKSTCLHLLQRFYDPDQGEVLIDGHDIRSLNISLLRSNVASVGQEPVLFSTTIGENIRYGKPDATDKEVVAAAQDSGAHDFISRLPLGYNTLVGEKGSQLSGGQKQRIAIARALIQNPKILLLDEATSALDYQSEKFVQETLDRASKGRTTIVVSHRLSAIRNADRILFIDKGQVVEDGTHNDLLASKGHYYDMISSASMEEEEEELDDNQNQLSTPNEYHEKTEKINGKQLFGEHQIRIEENHFRDLPVDVTKDDKSKESAKEKDNIQYWKVFKRIVILMRPDWFTIFLAILSSVIIGASLPAFAVVFGEVYGALSMEDSTEAYRAIIVMCIVFLSLGILMLITAITQWYWFSEAGVNLTTKLRAMTFAAILKQECGWFDDDTHSVGGLSARLTSDASNVQSAIGFPLCAVIQSLSTFIIGICISFNFSWKLSLVCLAAVPFSLFTVLLEAKHMSKTTMTEKAAIEEGTKIATEAITNIRTVASLRQEPHMIMRYVAEMNIVEKIIRKKLIWRGLINSVSQAIPLFGYAIALTYGGFLIANGEIHFKNVIKVSEALLYGTMVMSQTLVFAPAFTTAFVGAHRLFKIIDRDPQISSPNVANKSRKPDKGNDIEYKRIDFRYPTRPDVQILNNFNLSIEEGKTIALVGPSGCGKSTCIQLLQRLYDPEHGRVHIGLDEISSDISLNDLRSKLSIVSQEPVLFDKTIADNIAYGDNRREITMQEIIEAAKIANVHNFIVQLPNGYNTDLGSKGAQLSGGQKQRIAIARALIRNPKILLLDEATSALDLHSEQVVQQALDSARSGRTCLVIAHRLSTVQNADVICVLRNGAIVEYGTHNQLLALGGIYTRLYKAQK